MEQPNEYRSKSDLAYAYIRERIEDLTFQPGNRIVISQMAKSLSMSGIPVREALNRLESEGYVSVTPHSGYQVCTPERSTIMDKLEIQFALQALAISNVAKNISERDFAQIDAIDDKMRKAARDKDYLVYFKLRDELLREVFKHCTNRLLVGQLQSLSRDMSIFSIIFAMEPGWCERNQKTMSAIWKSVKERDGRLAAKLLSKTSEEECQLLSRKLVPGVHGKRHID